MLTRFSWQQYWCFIAIATVFYYAAVAILYYRSEILSRITGRKNSQMSSGPAGNYSLPPEEADDENDEYLLRNDTEEEPVKEETYEPAEEPINEESDFNEQDNEKFLELIENISEAISVVLSAHTGNNSKEELLQNIGHAVAGITGYEEIEKFREALDWHIERQAALICGLALSPRDIRQVWEIIQS